MNYDLASVSIAPPLLSGESGSTDITGLVWPTYRRVTLAQGGDHTADFIIDETVHNVTKTDLEQWFLTWIGYDVTENYAGIDTFRGYINEMRLYVGGMVMTISLDRMWNHVQFFYTLGSSGNQQITVAAEDADSQAIYGTKELIDLPVDYISQAWAEAKRDDHLAAVAWPMPFVEEVTIDRDDSAALEVYVKGYTHTLDFTHYEESGTTSTAISTQISDMISGHEFVSAGDIATIATTSTEESDYIRILDRIHDLLQYAAYEWGCFASRSFDLTARDLTTIKYRRRVYDQRRGLLQNGGFVPSPLVTPGGVVWTEDVFAGLPQSATLIEDPRAAYISAVEYSIDGVVLRDEATSDQDINALTAFALKKEMEIAADTLEKDYVIASSETDRFIEHPIGDLRR